MSMIRSLSPTRSLTLTRSLLLLPLLAGAPALAQTTVTGQPATGGASSATSGGQEAVTRPNTDHAQDGRHDAKMDPKSDARMDGKMDGKSDAPPSGTGTVANARLERGANSFTEGEARSRLERAGYGEVKDLKKDGDGIWRGQAVRAGKPASVGLDFKGNVAVQ